MTCTLLTVATPHHTQVSVLLVCHPPSLVPGRFFSCPQGCAPDEGFGFLETRRSVGPLVIRNPVNDEREDEEKEDDRRC